LENALTESKEPIPQLLTAIAELTTKRDFIRQQIDTMATTKATAKAKPVKAIQDILKVVESKPENEQHGLRLRLRGLVASIVDRVELEPYRNGRQAEARIKLLWKGCSESESIQIDTGKVSVEQVKKAVRIYYLPSIIVKSK
jgi:hypothetical protein